MKQEVTADEDVGTAADALARLLRHLDPQAEPGFDAAVRRVVEAVARGHSCVEMDGLPLPERTQLLAALRSSRLVCRVTAVSTGNDAVCPLVLDHDRLYLRRYWNYECDIAANIRRRIADAALSHAVPRETGSFCSAEQQAAVHKALQSPMALLSGGPGTGKTTILAELLLALVAQTPGGDAVPVAIAAPTGKAANRMGESLSAALQRRGVGEELRRRLPGEASTLHRLLGIGRDGQTPRFHSGNLLHAGIVVVDEASMIGLSMMARLLAAMRPDARLVLSGDAGQLASVEAGTVFADLVAAGQPGGVLERCTTVLSKNYRYGEESPIHRFCETVRSGDWESGRALLLEGAGALHWSTRLSEVFDTRVLSHFRAAASAASPGQALVEQRKGRVLCAVRNGPFGVHACNRQAAMMARANAGGGAGASGFAAGDPVIVLRNDHAQRLYNGDTGVMFPSEDGSHLQACFEGAGGVRRVSPLRLPPHELAYATSIHRSQGSEYDDVVVVLPEAGNRILSRELLYTAASRARCSVRIVASAEALEQCFLTPVARASGLLARLGIA